MSQQAICPKCGKAFCDEDYCPADGTPLVPAAEEDHSAQPEPPAVSNDSEATRYTSYDNAVEPGDGEPEEPEGRLASFMKRMGLRRPADKSASDHVNPPAAAVSVAEPASPLPEAVLEKGWRLTGPVQPGAGMDIWLVERPAEDRAAVSGHFHRFHPSALTGEAIYRRLEEGITPQLARIWAHGTVDTAGARADYELVSLPKEGRRFDQWIEDGSPSEQRAWFVFTLLARLLEKLLTSGIRPLALEPAHLVMTKDGELWLASAGMLADTTAANEFHPEFQRSALLPHGWTAPEITQQNMLSENAALFSVGQLTALAAWGQPCSLDEVQRGAVPFQSIRDARLAQVMMGCLWPRPAERWTVEQVQQAACCGNADSMAAAPPWQSLAPGASSTAFSFAGSSYWRLESLLAAAVKPSNWNEAISRTEAILDWANGTAWAGNAKLMREALLQGKSADWVLVTLARMVCPDLPVTWRGLDCSEEEAEQSLIALAQRALRDGESDAVMVRALFRADLRGAFGQGQQQ